MVVFRGLKLTDYILDDRHKNATYDLIAVSNHFGGLGGGHCKCIYIHSHTHVTGNMYYQEICIIPENFRKYV